MTRKFAAAGGLVAAFIVGLPGWASATVVGPISGNECGAGGFSACELTINGNVTPAIIKFDGDLQQSEVSTLFPSVTGSEFSFFDVLTSEGEVEGASFAYALGANDPGITGFAVFAAGDYLLYDAAEFSFSNGVYTGSFSTEGLGNNPNNPTPALSHITFFDTGAGTSPVPLPASALLLVAGLGGLALLRKRA